MLTFDPATYIDWKERNIETISIEFISSGCEGTSIKIHENAVLDTYLFIENQNSMIQIYSEKKYGDTLKGAYITHIGSKWILKSEGILTRCGCGKSFGIKTGDSKIDKIRLLKSKLSKSKGAHHS